MKPSTTTKFWEYFNRVRRITFDLKAPLLRQKTRITLLADRGVLGRIKVFGPVVDSPLRPTKSLAVVSSEDPLPFQSSPHCSSHSPQFARYSSLELQQREQCSACMRVPFRPVTCKSPLASDVMEK